MIARAMALVALIAAPASAQDFAAGSEAKSWNLYAEAPARFEATVVDLLCDMTGDCPADCGGGTRQLALLRTADNVLVFPMKNNQPAFTGFKPHRSSGNNLASLHLVQNSFGIRLGIARSHP